MKLALICAAGAFTVLAQHPEAIREGRQLFVKNCSACHGDTAKGGRGPDLTTGVWKHGGSVEDLVKNIVKGIPGTQMPAIPMPDNEARGIVAFLQSLSATPDERPTGDEAKGRALFFGAANCAVCHMFAGRGGIFGTDLSGSRARFKPTALTSRMAEPIHTVEVSPGLQGVVKGEDTFTLQIMDARQKWHMLNKRTLPKPLAKRETPHPALPADDRETVIYFQISPRREAPHRLRKEREQPALSLQTLQPLLGRELLIATPDGPLPLSDLLPHAFGPDDL